MSKQSLCVKKARGNVSRNPYFEVKTVGLSIRSPDNFRPTFCPTFWMSFCPTTWKLDNFKENLKIFELDGKCPTGDPK